MIDAWFKLGNAYFRAGRFKEAIEYYGRALELKPDYDLAVINIAGAYRHLGDDEAALAGFEHYLRLDPKDPYVRYQMGEIYLDRGDLAQGGAGLRARRSTIDSRAWRRPRTRSASSRSSAADLAEAERLVEGGHRDEVGRAAGALQPGADRRAARGSRRRPSATTSRS